MIEIRRCTNLDDVRELNRRVFGDLVSPVVGHWWVGYDGATPVCFGGVRRHRHGRESGGYLLRAGVLPDWQGLGLHARLVRVRCRWAKLEGYHWAWSYTAPWNARSMSTLIKCGFRPWSPRSFAGCNASKSWVYWRRGIMDV